MQTEFWARGYDYLSEDAAGITRTKRFLNEAYMELCEEEPWPFCEANQTGTSLDISDLRQVLSVNDSTNKTSLFACDRRTLREWYADLTTSGTALYWYLEGDSLKTYPVTTATLEVRYIASPAELVGDGDLCVVPSRYQYLIIDGAVLKGMKDSDNFQSFAALRTEYNNSLDRMRFNLLHRNYQDSDTILTAGLHESGYYGY